MNRLAAVTYLMPAKGLACHPSPLLRLTSAFSIRLRMTLASMGGTPCARTDAVAARKEIEGLGSDPGSLTPDHCFSQYAHHGARGAPDGIDCPSMVTYTFTP